MPGIWWQLSFVDPTKPKGDRWIGGVNVEADTLAGAVTWAHLRGINPGAEIEATWFYASWVDPNYVDRLITDWEEWITMPAPKGADR